MLEAKLKEAGFDVAEDNVKIIRKPNKEGLQRCFEVEGRWWDCLSKGG